MKKIIIVFILLFCTILSLSANIRVGIELRECEIISQSVSYPPLYSNFGIGVDYTLKRFGFFTSLYFNKLPYVTYNEYGEVLESIYYNIIDLTIGTRLYFLNNTRVINPFFSAIIDHRFLSIPENHNYPIANTFLETTIGLDFSFKFLSIIMEGGIIPVKYMNNSEFLFIPEDIDYVIAASLKYKL